VTRCSLSAPLVAALLLATGCGRVVPAPGPSAGPVGREPLGSMADRGSPAAAQEPPPADVAAAPTSEPAAFAPTRVAAAPTSEPAAFAPTRVALDAGAMGTKVTIAAYTTPVLDEAAVRPVIARALDEVRRIEALMTTWRDDSEVSRVNAAAGDAAVAVGPETLAVFEKSLWIASRSKGTFDITFDAMRGLWKFDEGAEDRVPARADVERARRLIDWKAVTVDAAASTVKLERHGMRVSFGGIAKGYAVDAASRILDRAGVTSFFVQAGGDLFVRGTKPGGAPFKVGVRDPRGGPSDFFATLRVVDHAFSTAGDYERSFVQGGRRYHHIIDPRTGYPAEASRSVTVWAKDAFTADAIDDAVFILGPKDGLALVESLDGVGAVIVDRENRVWVSERLKSELEVFRAPTDGI
jgi:thiamine biosynthesis lipoprotein